jgi:hypothetical protein
MDIEKQIDAVLEKQRSEQDEQARAALRAKFVEQDRLARETELQVAQAAARTAYLKRAEAAYGPACVEYKKATDAFRDARIQLQVLDTILNRSGGFSTQHLGVELRHATAAPDELDLYLGLPAAVDSMRRTLGG